MSDIIYFSNVRLSFPHIAQPQEQVNEVTGAKRISYNGELIMPLDHPLSEHQSVRFAQTLDYEHVGLAVNSAMAIYLEEQALHLGKRLRIRVRAEGFDGVMRMVTRGAGLGIVPQAALDRWQDKQEFKRVALSDAWADRKLLLCAADFSALPGYANALLEALSGG